MKGWWKRHGALMAMVAAALLCRLAVTLPALFDGAAAARFSRPDTPGYLGPALALAHDGAYLTSPGGVPTAVRAPGFPVLAAAVDWLVGDANFPNALALTLALISAATVIPVFLAGSAWGGRRVGLLAAGLFTLYPTAIGNAPMFLSDSWFGFVVAWQVWLLLRFRSSHRAGWFLGAMAAAALGALIRPINSAWWFPALFLLAVSPGVPWRRKLATAAAALAIWGVILLPWMGRNAALGEGWCIDANTGAMYHQNGAMLLAAVNGTEYEQEKQQILADLDRRFADRAQFPDGKSRTDYRMARFRELVSAHPVRWLSQHFQWRILLPDAPTLLETLGLTRSDRGTMNVMQRDGVWAAVRFYFDGKLYLPLLLLPLLLVAGATLAAAAAVVVNQLFHWRRDWFDLLLFLAVAEYYFFLPGPITAPRYQLPALPLLTVLAASGMLAGIHWYQERRCAIRN